MSLSMQVSLDFRVNYPFSPLLSSTGGGGGEEMITELSDLIQERLKQIVYRC